MKICVDLCALTHHGACPAAHLRERISLLIIPKTFDFTGVNVYNMFVLCMQHSFFV